MLYFVYAEQIIGSDVEEFGNGVNVFGNRLSFAFYPKGYAGLGNANLYCKVLLRDAFDFDKFFQPLRK